MGEENIYSTYFFKDYGGMAEKVTFSAFVPDRDKGIWCIGADEERGGSFAGLGVASFIREYMSRNIFSVEDINRVLNEVNQKIRKEKFLMNRDFEKDASILSVLIDSNRMLAGNIGRSTVKIFRDNEVYSEISGNIIKEVELKINDYILMGTTLFWENISENDIADRLIRAENRNELERYITSIIVKAQLKSKEVIPYMSIFIEDLKQEEIGERGYWAERRENPVVFLLVGLIFLFLSVSVGRTILESRSVRNNGNQIHLEEKKLTGITPSLKMDKVYNSEMNESGMEKRKNFKIEEQNVEDAESDEKAYNKGNLEVIGENINLAKLENKIVQRDSRYENKSVKIIPKIKKREKGKLGTAKTVNKKKVKKRSTERVKSKIDKLEEEIQKNWEILGRDSDGNKKEG